MFMYERKTVNLFGKDFKWKKLSYVINEIVNEVKCLSCSLTKNMYIGLVLNGVGFNSMRGCVFIAFLSIYEYWLKTDSIVKFI